MTAWLVLAAIAWPMAGAETVTTLTLRGKAQRLHVYGRPGGQAVLVSSGDGGWMHLGPQVAEFLASRGYYVVGFDVKAYLASFTTGTATLDPAEEPGDYAALVRFAGAGSDRKPILVGVSEGAGLSVLAATHPAARDLIAGVVALGLPDVTELGWRWKDSVIYLTHGTPNEPSFQTAAVIDRVSPLPLAAIHSTHDEFVPLETARQLVEKAREPRRFWEVRASDHRFSDNPAGFQASLLEALAWTVEHAPR